MKRSLLGPINGMVFLVAVAGCSVDVAPREPSAVNPSIRTLAWTPTAPSTIDAGSGLAFAPRVAVEPDGGGTAFAVWVERVDINPFDLKPAVYHIYGRRFTGGGWALADSVSGCSAAGPNLPNDGICLLDSLSLDFDAWAPRISMDADGNAVLVWQQADASDCDGATLGTQTCTSIYTRTFNPATVPPSWTAATLIDDGNTPSSSPDVSVEPDPANNGGVDDGFGSALAVWTQFKTRPVGWSVLLNNTGTETEIRDYAFYDGQLYAAQAGTAAGDGKVLVFNGTAWLDATGAGSGFPAATYEEVSTIYTFHNYLYAGTGNTAGADADVWQYDGTTWTKVLDGETIDATFSAITALTSIHMAGLYAGTAGGNGDILQCDTRINPAGDMINCDSTEWSRVLDIAAGGRRVEDMINFGQHLYVSWSGAAAGDGQIAVCFPAGGGNGGTCDNAGDWATDTNVGSAAPFAVAAGVEAVFDFAIFNSKLYVGTGTSAGDGDVWICDPTLAGFASACDAPGDWSITYNGAQESIRSLSVFINPNARLYAGQGDGAGDGDVIECNPRITDDEGGAANGSLDDELTCSTADWNGSLFLNSGYERVESLRRFDGQLFAGMGSAAANGDIQAYNSVSGGWQTLARRCVDGADAGTACGDTGGEWSATVSDITGGAGSLTPKIAVNREGIAAASFVRLRVSNCDQSRPLNDADDILSSRPGTNITTTLHVDCGDDRLYVNRFDGTNWLGTWDITPRETLGARPPFGAFDGNNLLTEEANCWEWGSTNVVDPSNQDGGVEDQFESSPCVDIGEPDVAIDASGNSAVSFKAWEWNQVHDGTAPRNTTSQGYLLASQHVVSVYAKRFNGTASWLPSSWVGANWLGTPAFIQGTAPLGQYRYSYDVTTPLELSTCSSIRQNDPSLISNIMNCDLRGVALAMEPDPADNDLGGPDDLAGSAFVVYERFNGTRRDIVAHRFAAGVWGVPNTDGADVDINDGGLVEAEVDIDDCNNVLAVAGPGTCWGQTAGNANDLDASTTIDAFAPQIAMDSVGNAMLVWAQEDGSGFWRVYGRRFVEGTGWDAAATLNIPIVDEHYFEPMVAMEALNPGNVGSVGDAFSVFSALDGVLNIFRIDSSVWTP